MSIAITLGIRVEITSQYIEEQSSPAEDYYFLAYRVKISNRGEETVQLLARRWIITDSEGREQRVVRGDPWESPRIS